MDFFNLVELKLLIYNNKYTSEDVLSTVCYNAEETRAEASNPLILPAQIDSYCRVNLVQNMFELYTKLNP